MNSNLEFLKERLETAKRRVAASDDYKEMKVLEKIINELGQYTPLKEEPKKMKGGFTKNEENSPVAEIRRGGRIKYVYKLIEGIVYNNDKSIEIGALEKILKIEHNIDMVGKGSNQSSNIPSYINIYNKAHPDAQHLFLWPQKKPGEKRVGKYTHITYLKKRKKWGKGHSHTEETKRKMSEIKKAYYANQKKPATTSIAEVMPYERVGY